MDLYDRIQEHKAKAPKSSESSLYDRIQEHKENESNKETDYSYSAAEGREHRQEALEYLKEPLISALNFGQTIGKYTNPLEYIWPQPNIDWRQATGGVPEEKRNFGHMAAGFVPELAATLAVPQATLGPRAVAALGRFGAPAARVALNSLAQGGIGAAFNSENPLGAGMAGTATSLPFAIINELSKHSHPLVRQIARLGSKAGLGYAAHEVTKGVTGSEAAADTAAIATTLGMSRPGLNALARKINRGRQNPLQEQALMEAGERLGIHVKPSEANPTFYMGQQVGNVGKTSGGSVKLAENQAERTRQEQDAILRLFHTISSPEAEDQISALYDKAGKTIVPEKYTHKYEGKPVRNNYVETKEGDKYAKKDLFAEKPGQNFVETPEGEIILKKDLIEEATGKIKGGKAIFREAIKQLENDVTYQDILKNTPKNSIEYYNQVKRKLYAMERAAKRGDKPDLTSAANIKKVRKQMTKDLDKYSDEYKEARELSELKKVKEGLIKAFNKKPLTMANMAQVLGDKAEFDKLIASTRNAPKAQQQLRDMQLLAQHMGGKNLDAKAGERMAQLDTNMVKSAYDAMRVAINEHFGGNFDVAAVELMYNPKWRDEVHRLSQITDREKLTSEGLNLFGKILSQSASNAIGG